MNLWCHLCVSLALFSSLAPFGRVMCQFYELMCRFGCYRHLFPPFTLFFLFVFNALLWNSNALKFFVYEPENEVDELICTTYAPKWSLYVPNYTFASFLLVWSSQLVFLDLGLVPKAFCVYFLVLKDVL